MALRLTRLSAQYLALDRWIAIHTDKGSPDRSRAHSARQHEKSMCRIFDLRTRHRRRNRLMVRESPSRVADLTHAILWHGLLRLLRCEGTTLHGLV